MNYAATLLIVCCLPVLSAAQAFDTLPAFGYTGLTQLRQVKADGLADAPPVAARAADVITRDNLLLQAGKTVLFGYAKTDAEFHEALAYWTPVLSAAGIKAGAATFDAETGMYQIPYTAPGGKVVRAFMAEARQFPPKDEAGLRTNMAASQDALAKAGLTPVAARVVNLEEILPTYSLLYLAAADDVPEHERLLRVLKPGDDLDLDLIKTAGVSVVQVPETWMVVYIGPELGVVGMVAHDRDELDKKIAARKDFLAQQGKKMIGEKIEPVDDPEWKFEVQLYFYQ
jgi:hypothetical protein